MLSQIAEVVCWLSEQASGHILTEAKTILYHGTSTINLPTILSRGLYWNPKRRVWGEDEEAFFDVASYPGTYLASDVRRAFFAAERAVEVFGGGKALVAVQVETRTPQLVLDEDDLPRCLAGLDSSHVYAIATGTASKEMMNWAVEEIIDSLRAHMPAKMKQFIPMTRLFAARQTIENWLVSGAKQDAARMGYDKFGNAKNLKQDYRAATDKLLRLLNFLATPGRCTYRMTEPITFRGRNRILAVIDCRDLDRRSFGPAILRFVYGKAKGRVMSDLEIFFMRDASNDSWSIVEKGIVVDVLRRNREAQLQVESLTEHQELILYHATIPRFADEILDRGELIPSDELEQETGRHYAGWNFQQHVRINTGSLSHLIGDPVPYGAGVYMHLDPEMALSYAQTRLEQEWREVEDLEDLLVDEDLRFLALFKVHVTGRGYLVPVGLNEYMCLTRVLAKPNARAWFEKPQWISRESEADEEAKRCGVGPIET